MRVDVVARRLAGARPLDHVAVAPGRLAQAQLGELDAELAQQFAAGAGSSTRGRSRGRGMIGAVPAVRVARPGGGRSIAMVRVPGEQARRAVDLLGEQHPHEAVRQRQRRQRDDRRRRGASVPGRGRRRCRSRTRPSRASSRQRASCSGEHAASSTPCPRSSRATISVRPGRRRAMRVASTASSSRHRLAAVARLGLQFDQVEGELARQAPRVIVPAGVDPGRASGDRARRREAFMGRARAGSAGCCGALRRSGLPCTWSAAGVALVRRRAAFGRLGAAWLRPSDRRGRRPQLLEVVVRAHRGLHDVDDDVAGVDQHPLAGRPRLRRR